MSTTLRFVVFGRGTLPEACCTLLAERGLAPMAVVSDDSRMARWAHSVAIPCLATPAELGQLHWSGAPPVLLSIANEQLIAADVLALFAQAINFHDAPLPRYAGSHATAWALLERQRRHAVCWHRMTASADAGDIVLEVPLRVAADETSFSLNAKCHDAALVSFPSLLQALLQGDLPRRRQLAAQRRFFARDRRPDGCAVLEWTRDADDLSALVRALAFGPYVNRLGCPKVWFGTAFATLEELTVGAARSTAAPGSVVDMTEEHLTVATASHDVALGGFRTLEGRALPVPDLSLRFGVREGAVLAPPEPARMAAAAAAACGWKEEARWMEALRGVRPLVLALRTSGPVVLSVPHDEGFASMLAWLARTSGKRTFDLGLRCVDPVPREAHTLLAATRPFRVQVDPAEPFSSFRGRCAAALAAWRARKPYLRDAVLRYPGVYRPSGWQDFGSWPVTIELELRATDIHEGFCDDDAERCAAELATLRADAEARPDTPLGRLAMLPRGELNDLSEALELMIAHAPTRERHASGMPRPR